MIAVDTSALIAIIFDEPLADVCISRLEAEPIVLLSAGTVAEALIVAGRRGHGVSMGRLIENFGFEIVAVTAAVAQRVADAYGRWGKGVHPAGLNFGDCFAYALARENDCPLLFVGDDFAKTDVRRAV